MGHGVYIIMSIQYHGATVTVVCNADLTHFSSASQKKQIKSAQADETSHRVRTSMYNCIKLY